MTGDGAAPVRVLLADDQPMLRTGYRTILRAEPDLHVVGEAGDGVEAVELARRLQPDVLLIDARLPRLDGVAATRAIVRTGLPVRVLILTHLGDEVELDDPVLGALRACASGLLAKDIPAGELAAAVRTAAAGHAVVAPQVLRRLLDRLPGAPPELAAGTGPDLRLLTEREREVLVQVARGLSNAEIAKVLAVSETTVKTHVGHLLTKLGLRDRVQAVVLAHESGLVRRARG